MSEKDIIRLQLRSLFAYKFMYDYQEFEGKIKELFISGINELPDDKKYKYYYFYGGTFNSNYDYNKPSISYSQKTYHDSFEEISVAQLVNVAIKQKELPIFDFSIDLIQHKNTLVSFSSCLSKLGKMRNILAHHLPTILFKDESIIELLSLEKIKEYNFEITNKFDLDDMDDIAQAIASNLVLLQEIKKRLGISGD